jgi:hypothetical protein
LVRPGDPGLFPPGLGSVPAGRSASGHALHGLPFRDRGGAEVQEGRGTMKRIKARNEWNKQPTESHEAAKKDRSKSFIDFNLRLKISCSVVLRGFAASCWQGVFL